MTSPRPAPLLSCLLIAALLVLLAPTSARANWPAVPPPLPAPTGRIVNVSTEAALQAAVAGVTSDTTIVIAAGTYALSQSLYFHGPLSNVSLRGATNNRDDVVLVGQGRDNESGTPYGIWVGDAVVNLLVANLTIRDVYYHCIIYNPGPQSPRIYNIHAKDAGQQLIKTNPNDDGTGINNGVIEYSAVRIHASQP